MKNFLVDVPVAIQAFVRPQMLKLQWQIIKKARPSILFIRSDGPRINVPTDKDNIIESRKICEDIDWDCKVYKLYFDENQGMYGISQKCTPFIWEHVDRCIFLEDDQIPAVSFFQYCAELLEKYKNDSRIYCITGVNLCEEWSIASSDYFFARVPASSGIAIWRKNSLSNIDKLKFSEDPYIIKILKQNLPWYLNEQFSSIARNGTYAGHIPASEFFVRASEYLCHQLVIVPKYNQISNIGIGKGSTHTSANKESMPKELAKQYSLQTKELDFPLKHPQFIFPDTYFEKEREKQLGVSSRFKRFTRNVERVYRLLINFEFERIKAKIHRIINNEIEK